MRELPEFDDVLDPPFDVDDGLEDIEVLVPFPALDTDPVLVAGAAVLVSVLPGVITVLVTSLSLEFVPPTAFPQATNLSHPV